MVKKLKDKCVQLLDKATRRIQHNPKPYILVVSILIVLVVIGFHLVMMPLLIVYVSGFMVWTITYPQALAIWILTIILIGIIKNT